MQNNAKQKKISVSGRSSKNTTATTFFRGEEAFLMRDEMSSATQHQVQNQVQLTLQDLHDLDD